MFNEKNGSYVHLICKYSMKLIQRNLNCLQISSILDETNRTNKMYQDSKEEIEALKVKFQEIQNVYKTTESSLNTDLENLKEELSQKSQLQAVASELEQQLSAADTKHKEEVLLVIAKYTKLC